MNDIDSRLRSQSYQTPRRPLAKDFADLVMERSLVGSRQSRFMNWISMKGIFTMKLHIKRASLAIGVGVALLFGAGAYAAIRWVGYDDGASYGGVTTLSNGDTRFWVSANGNCEPGKRFYEIKKGAYITPAQISDMVAGTCETTDIGALFSNIPLDGSPMATIPGHVPQATVPAVQKRYYTTSGTVKALYFAPKDSNMMTITFSRKSGYATETFPIVTNVQVFDKGQLISLSALKAGDSVELVMQVQATSSAIQNLSLNWQDAGHDTLPGSSIYGIVLTHHLVYDVYAEGREFTHLVPNPKDIQGMSYRDASAYDQNPANLHEEYPL